MTEWDKRPAATYDAADKARAAERFRHHIWSPKMPHRRIHRPYRCCYCKKQDVQTHAHHVDYSRPFLVSWLCVSCHRSVEQDGIKLRSEHLFNYRSLVLVHPKRWRRGGRGPQAQSIVGRRRKKALAEVPF